jgi:hypothetical protein
MAGRLPRVTGAVGAIDTAGEGGVFTPGFGLPVAVTETTTLSGANLVRAIQIVLPLRVVVGKLVFEVTTTSASDLCSVGIYDKDKNRLFHSGAVSTTSAEIKDINLASSVTLEPGVYWSAWTGDNTTFKLRAAVTGTTANAIFRTNSSRCGAAANSSSSGVLPATLGDITGASLNAALIYLEP